VTLGGQFWRFWTATLLANLGDGIGMAAFPLLAASITGDPFAVAAVAAATSIPWLVAGLIAGSLADRHNARTLLVLADLTRIVVLGVLIVALALGQPPVLLVAVVAFALGVSETVRDTTASTVVPRLVPTRLLERANGRMVAGEVVTNSFAGPLIGGMLFAVGAALPFVANSAVLVFAVLLVVGLPVGLLGRSSEKTESVDPVDPVGLADRVDRGDPANSTDPTDRPHTNGDAGRGILGGLRWLAGHRTLRVLLLVGALVTIADGGWYAIFVLFSEQRLGLGPSGFGVLLAVGAAGGLLGASLAERIIGVDRHGPALLGSIVLTAVTPALLLIAPTLPAAGAVVVITSAGFGVFDVAVASLRHRLSPQGLLGRVVAAYRTVLHGAGALVILAGGGMAAAHGLGAPLIMSAVIGIIACVLCTRGTWTVPVS
jgi:MFS family permease